MSYLNSREWSKSQRIRKSIILTMQPAFMKAKIAPISREEKPLRHPRSRILMTTSRTKRSTVSVSMKGSCITEACWPKISGLWLRPPSQEMPLKNHLGRDSTHLPIFKSVRTLSTLTALAQTGISKFKTSIQTKRTSQSHHHRKRHVRAPIDRPWASHCSNRVF